MTYTIYLGQTLGTDPDCRLPGCGTIGGGFSVFEPQQKWLRYGPPFGAWFWYYPLLIPCPKTLPTAKKTTLTDGRFFGIYFYSQNKGGGGNPTPSAGDYTITLAGPGGSIVHTFPAGTISDFLYFPSPFTPGTQHQNLTCAVNVWTPTQSVPAGDMDGTSTSSYVASARISSYALTP